MPPPMRAGVLGMARTVTSCPNNRLIFEIGAPAIRLFPQYHGIELAGDEMRVAVAAAAVAGIPVILTVRLEDERQRHPLDTAPELPAASVRELIRSDEQARVIVANANAAYVEEVHFGLTTAEAERVLWDLAWIWGPPENHMAKLIDTMGVQRFVLGTGMPLRIPETPFARLDLLDLSPAERAALLGGNLNAFLD